MGEQTQQPAGLGKLFFCSAEEFERLGMAAPMQEVHLAEPSRLSPGMLTYKDGDGKPEVGWSANISFHATAKVEPDEVLQQLLQKAQTFYVAIERKLPRLPRKMKKAHRSDYHRDTKWKRKVVNIIRQQLQQPRPRYIVRINQEYLEMVYRNRCIYTDSEKQELLHTIIEQIRQFVRGEGKSDTLAAFTFKGSDGREHKSFELEAVSEGDPLLAVVEDLQGREVQRVAIKDKEADTPASCHDCQHWQDGDDGPQCEYPDMPPCRE